MESGTQPASTTARLAPTAPPSAPARSSSSGKLSGPPMPRPPLTTTFASSSFTFSDASTTWSTMRARFEPSPIVTARSFTSAVPPDSLASKDLGRTSTIAGLAFARIEATLAPPKYGTLATNPPSLASMSEALEINPLPSRAASRPAMSRESLVNPKRIRSAGCCLCRASSASAAGSARNSSKALSSLTKTVFAPCLPSASAAAFAPVPSATAVTSPRSRARVMISRAVGCSLPWLSSATTRTFATSDHLRVGQDLDDLLDRAAVVLDDRAGLAGLAVDQTLDRLRALAALDAEVGESQLLHLFGARGHDPLERRVARLRDRGRDRYERRRGRLHHHVAVARLPVDLDGRSIHP